MGEEYFINIETGELFFSFDAMYKEACELYDIDDDTNTLTWRDYYIYFVKVGGIWMRGVKMF